MARNYSNKKLSSGLPWLLPQLNFLTPSNTKLIWGWPSIDFHGACRKQVQQHFQNVSKISKMVSKSSDFQVSNINLSNISHVQDKSRCLISSHSKSLIRNISLQHTSSKTIKWSQIFSYNPQPKTPKPQNPKNQIELDKYFDFQKISSQMSRANFSTQSWPECLQNFEKLSGHDQVKKFALCIWLKIISQLRNLSSN